MLRHLLAHPCWRWPPSLDAEIWIHGDAAGRVASAIERAFRQEMDTLFDHRHPAMDVIAKKNSIDPTPIGVGPSYFSRARVA